MKNAKSRFEKHNMLGYEGPRGVQRGKTIALVLLFVWTDEFNFRLVHIDERLL